MDSEVRQSEKKDKGKGREERAGSGSDEVVVVKNVAPGEGRKMTEAERRFEEIQRLRVRAPFRRSPFEDGRYDEDLMLISIVERGEGEKDG